MRNSTVNYCSLYPHSFTVEVEPASTDPTTVEDVATYILIGVLVVVLVMIVAAAIVIIYLLLVYK